MKAEIASPAAGDNLVISMIEGARLISTTEMFSRHGLKKSRGHELIHNGLLPRPLEHAGRFSRVPSFESDATWWARLRGWTDAEIRTLVSDLNSARAAGPLKLIPILAKALGVANKGTAGG